MASDADVTVVVLQWGKAEETERCIEALTQSRGVRYDLIVVDNDSPEPDAVDRLRERWPDLEVIENGSNLGFAGGNNVALLRLVKARERGDAPRWCMLLNNDVEVSRDCLVRMLRVGRERGAGAVGAINEIRGSHRVGSSGGVILWPSARYRDVGAEARATGFESWEVETIAGSTLMLDLDALRRVGLLDERFFCVYEETDLCRRLQDAGYPLCLASQATASHAVGASTSRALHFYFRFRNRVHFARRHGGRGALRRLLPGLGAELAWRLPAYCLKGRPGESWAILRGVLDGVRGRYGPGPFMAA